MFSYYSFLFFWKFVLCKLVRSVWGRCHVLSFKLFLWHVLPNRKCLTLQIMNRFVTFSKSLLKFLWWFICCVCMEMPIFSEDVSTLEKPVSNMSDDCKLHCVVWQPSKELRSTIKGYFISHKALQAASNDNIPATFLMLEIIIKLYTLFYISFCEGSSTLFWTQ